MSTTVNIEYNHFEAGPRVAVFGEHPVLVYWYNEINGVKKHVDQQVIEPGHWYQIGRQWFNNWIIEAHEWNGGNLLTIKEEKFNPYNKSVYFRLDENSPIEEHREYLKACMDFVSHWRSSSYNIESPYAHELLEENPGMKISHKIMDEDCYVAFVIKKTPSDSNVFENFGFYGLNDEMVYFNFHHPENPDQQTPYEFAKSILFGPDYSKLEEFILHDWTLKERIVY